MLVAKTELSYYPEEVLQVKEKPKKQVKKLEKKKRRNNSLVKMFILTLPMIILAISLSILFRYAGITSIRRDITRLESQKLELERIKMDLIGELEGLKSSVRISEDAITKLGMDYPTEGQIVYLTVNDSIIEQAEKPSGINPLRKIISMVSNRF